MAVLQAGDVPLWFQLTEDEPVLIEAIEDAVFSRALVPWPLALHVRFLQEKDGEVIMAVNRDGFMNFTYISEKQAEEGKSAREGVAMYRFPDKNFKQYSIGGFVFYKQSPVVLLYLDDRFLDPVITPPDSRTWSFDMTSNNPFPVKIPVLEHYPVQEKWEVDTLRQGSDGFFYYRIVKKEGNMAVFHMLRTEDLDHAGKEISIEVFYSFAPRVSEISNPSLPLLPEGFSYTAIGRVGDNLIASWEEQEDYSIGAAGFVVIKVGREQ
jgi:hypothetical protein